MINRDSTFSKPHLFDDKLSEIKRKIAQLRAKTLHQIGPNGQPHFTAI